VRAQLLRTRFAAKAEIEPETHDAWLVLGGEEVIDVQPDGEEIADDAFERWRIENAIPEWGRELDEQVLPAEAGLTKTHVSFTKGCYPGQEPIARQHYRGKVNRRLRVLETEGEVAPGTEVSFGDKVVGRVTSAVDGLALAYVRSEVPDDADLEIGGRRARLH
jgi:folate-binding protein YgfZ